MVRTAIGRDADHTGCGYLNAVVNSIPPYRNDAVPSLKHPSVLGKAYIFRTNSNNAISFKNSASLGKETVVFLIKALSPRIAAGTEIDKTNKISHHLIGRMGIDIKKGVQSAGFRHHS